MTDPSRVAAEAAARAAEFRRTYNLVDMAALADQMRRSLEQYRWLQAALPDLQAFQQAVALAKPQLVNVRQFTDTFAAQRSAIATIQQAIKIQQAVKIHQPLIYVAPIVSYLSTIDVATIERALTDVSDDRDESLDTIVLAVLVFTLTILIFTSCWALTSEQRSDLGWLITAVWGSAALVKKAMNELERD